MESVMILLARPTYSWPARCRREGRQAELSIGAEQYFRPFIVTVRGASEQVFFGKSLWIRVVTGGIRKIVHSIKSFPVSWRNAKPDASCACGTQTSLNEMSGPPPGIVVLVGRLVFLLKLKAVSRQPSAFSPKKPENTPLGG